MPLASKAMEPGPRMFEMTTSGVTSPEAASCSSDKRTTLSEQPLLNKRGAQLIGRVFPLDQAIVNGRGRLKIADGALWIATGPDLPTGLRVKIVAVDGTLLRVEPAE